jgi:hypothetical protein
MDLQGSFLASSLAPSATFCQSLCCGTPLCQGYAFSQGILDSVAAGGWLADCYLYSNISFLMPSSTMSSGVVS